jgi:hypothetical protein
VLELSREQIKPAPQLNSTVDSGFITGIGAVKNGDAERHADPDGHRSPDEQCRHGPDGPAGLIAPESSSRARAGPLT